jgi:very-short-patch-repair endonuclease
MKRRKKKVQKIFSPDKEKMDALREKRAIKAPAQKVIWDLVRNDRCGTKFRREQQIDKMFVDFYSLELDLIIDIIVDSENDFKKHANNRQVALNKMGFQVITLYLSEIAKNKKKIDEQIKAEVKRINKRFEDEN